MNVYILEQILLSSLHAFVRGTPDALVGATESRLVLSGRISAAAGSGTITTNGKLDPCYFAYLLKLVWHGIELALASPRCQW